MTSSKNITSTEFPRVKTQRELWEAWTAPETLEDCVKLLFEILDSKEVSAEDRQFRPTYISTVRVWDAHRLNKLLPRMKELSNTTVK